MRKALDVSEAGLEIGKDFDHTIGLMFSPKTFGNLTCVFVWTTHKSNRLGGKHRSKCLHLAAYDTSTLLRCLQRMLALLVELVLQLQAGLVGLNCPNGFHHIVDPRL